MKDFVMLRAIKGSYNLSQCVFKITIITVDEGDC